MTFKKAISCLACAIIALNFAGCARNIGGNVYKASAVGESSFSYQGTVASVRQVQVEEGEYLEENQMGLGLGAVAGGLAAGSTIGKGNGQLLSGALGAIAGGLGGAYAEKALKSQTALEYVVQLTNGNMMTVVQGLDNPLQIGQRVIVIVGLDGRSRVIADQTATQSIQPMTRPNVVKVR